MDEIVNEIVDLIKDYRNDDGITLDSNHVSEWINQFDEGDREFLLTELLHILTKSYLSKEKAIEILKSSFEYLRERYKYDSVKGFIEDTCFLSCQAENKSQSILLRFLDEISTKEYGISIFKCSIENAKQWVYFDDVLASGGTFRKNIISTITQYGSDKYSEKNIKTICIFFFLHTWGMTNAKYFILKKFSEDLADTLVFHRVTEIENNPRINYFNPNPSFNHVFPQENEIGTEFINQLEDKLNLEWEMKNESFAFRPQDKPTKEEFFSSAENRIRYENILLNKGIDIFNSIDSIHAKGIRPLGFTLPTNKTLGTGSHAFTWRNISNTCPLVYWWEVNNWIPLFSVQNRGGN